MRTSSQLLLTFLLNAVWQIALIAGLASLGAWLLRRSAMRYQHWLWVGALCLSVLVPLVTALRSFPHGSTPVVQTTTYQREFAASFASEPIPLSLERTPASFWNSSVSVEPQRRACSLRGVLSLSPLSRVQTYPGVVHDAKDSQLRDRDRP